MDNRELISKAKVGLAELTAGSGVLSPANAKEFLRIAITEASLMPQCTVVPMRAPKQRINLVGLGSRVLRAGTPGQGVQVGAGQTGVEFSEEEFDAKLFRGEIPLEEEVLEDAIEQGRFKDTILSLIPQAVGRDLDEIIVNGDTASADPFLAQFDGFLKQATSHVVDFEGAKLATIGAADPYAKLTAMIRKVPRNWRRELDRMKFLTSFQAADDYTNAVIARPTVGGDQALAGANGSAMFKKRPIDYVGMWPDNLGDDENYTAALFCNPKNLQVGIWRDVKIQVYPQPREGMIYFIVSLRVDAKIAIEDAVIKGTNILN